jgi:tRNA (guanine-N7-)-methyltransferase
VSHEKQSPYIIDLPSTATPLAWPATSPYNTEPFIEPIKSLAVRPFRTDRLPLGRGTPLARLDSTRPLDIELGCGAGMHSLSYAQANPERDLVALERTTEKFEKFQRSLLKQPKPLANLTAINADAVPWIVRNLSIESVERCILLYPNPYPKNKDRNKRWHAMPFFEFLLSTLKQNGTIQLATNERFYFDEALLYFEKYWNLKPLIIREISLSSVPDFQPRTHFEKKYFLRGETCFDAIFTKKS